MQDSTVTSATFRAAVVLVLILASAAAARAQKADLPETVRYTASDGSVYHLDARADTDGDGVDNGLELDGFAFDIRDGDISSCSPEVDDPCYQTDPFRWSTDGDPYSDLMEVTGANLDGVEAPYNHPLVTARPIISVYLTGYDVIPMGEITDTEGRSQSSEFTNSTTTTEELGGSITGKVSLNPLELASVEMEVNYSYSRATMNGSTSASGFDWSTAQTVQEDAAARLRLNLYYKNLGSASAAEISPTISLRLGGRTIATFTPGDGGTANSMAPGERYPETGTIAVQTYGDDDREIIIGLEDLKAIQRGTPLTLVVTQVDALIERWDPDTNSFYSDIPWAQFEDRIDPVTVTVHANVGGELHQYQVFTGSPQYDEPWFDLREVLGLVFDVEERGGETYINNRLYPDQWYMSTDSDPLLQAWDAAGKPENFLGLPMERRNRLMMLSPGSDLAPAMHFSTYSEDLKHVITSSSAVGGFPIQRAEATLYVDDGVRTVELDAYEGRPYFSNSEPLADRFYGGFVTVYNARGDAVVQDLQAPSRTTELQTCAQYAEAAGEIGNFASADLFMTGAPGVLLPTNCNFTDPLNPVENPWFATRWSDGLNEDHPPAISVGVVHVLNEQVAFAGYGNSEGPNKSALRRSADGGQTWTDLADVTGTIIRDIEFVDETTGFAVGWHGKVFKTSDAGLTWTEVRQTFTNSALTGVDFFDPQNGLIAGGEGTLLRTSDGGETWTSLDVNTASSTATLHDVAMPGPAHFVVGAFDAVHVSMDGGTSWTQTSASSVMGTSSTWVIRGIHFPSRRTGYVYNSSGMMKTTDAGNTWEALDPNTRTAAGASSAGVFDAHFFDTRSGIAIAGGTLLHTIDGGQTWYAQEASNAVRSYGAIHFSGGGGLVSGSPEDVESAYNTVLFRTAPIDLRSGPDGSPYTLRPKDLLVYYHDDPAAINGAATIEEAAQELGRYEYVILADWPTLGPKGEHLSDIFSHPALDRTMVFGRVDAGVTTANHEMIDIINTVAMMLGTGMDGIFLDNFGYDYGTSRQRQNALVEFVTDDMNVPVIVSATNPDNAFSAVVGVHNVNGVAPSIGPADFFFWDGYQVDHGEVVGAASWRAKADKLAAYRDQYGFRILSSTSVDDGGTYDEQLFRYAWHAALIDGHHATGWGEPAYGAAGAEAPYRERPSFDPGRTFFDDIVIDLPIVHRKMERGEVRLNTETLEVNTSASTVAIDEAEELPSQIHLDQNYPNPFNPTTTITFELSQPQDVRLEVFDLLGRRVALLLDESRVTGRHQVRFDARDLASGLYVYRLVAGSVVKARTMVVVK